MDQHSNVNLQVVQGDFPIKYGPKTQIHPWSISQKTLRPFRNYIFKIPIFFLLFQIVTETLQFFFRTVII